MSPRPTKVADKVPQDASDVVEEKWEALPPTLPRRTLQALFGRTFTKLVGPPGPTALAWGGSAAQRAHARLEDENADLALEMDAALMGLCDMPGGCRRGSLEDLADWYSHAPIADFVAIRERYRSSPAALNVLKARFAVSNQMLRSGVQVWSLHLHKYARDCTERGDEE